MKSPRPLRFAFISGPLAAFSLVEVVLALGITSFAILAIIGLLGGAMSTNRESEQRIQAADLATRLLSEYQQALANRVTNTGAWPQNFPFVEGTSLPASAPTAFSAPQGITVQGTKASGLQDRDAAFAFSYMVWQSDIGDNAAYKLVNCAVKLQWPPPAVGSRAGKVDHYEATTSFFVNQ